MIDVSITKRMITICYILLIFLWFGNTLDKGKSMQLATRIDDAQGALFKETARALGTTPSDALRMFIVAFNHHHGFPYDVRLVKEPPYEPFASEQEALDFTTRAMKAAVDEAR